MEIKKELSFHQIANCVYAINGNPNDATECPGIINWSEAVGQGKKKSIKIKHANDFRLNLSYFKIPLETINELFKAHGADVAVLKEEATPILEKYAEFKSEEGIMPKTKQEEMEKELEPLSAQVSELNAKLNADMSETTEVTLRTFTVEELGDYDIPQRNYIYLAPCIADFVEL